MGRIYINIRPILFSFIFFYNEKKRNNFAIKRVINQTSFLSFHFFLQRKNETILRFVGCVLYVRPFFFSFFFLQRKKTKQKKRRRCISELYGKFIVQKTKIQKLASLKQSEFFNVFLTIFSYSEIRRRINNKVDCANNCYLLLVVVCSNGVFTRHL